MTTEVPTEPFPPLPVESGTGPRVIVPTDDDWVDEALAAAYALARISDQKSTGDAVSVLDAVELAVVVVMSERE